MDALGRKDVPSSTVTSSMKERLSEQGPAVAVAVSVGVGRGVNKAGTDVVVDRGCAGGAEVGGRNGVDVV
jgi:hypothetical protein